MIQWLYRYIFRGIGILLLIGMLTILALAISSHRHRFVHTPASSRAGESR